MTRPDLSSGYVLSGGEAGGIAFVQHTTRASHLRLHRDADGYLLVEATIAPSRPGSIWRVNEHGYAVALDEEHQP